jgi:PTS system nitrogen regulatory IIA component
MIITDLITPERIVCDCEVTSKKRVIEVLSERLATGQADLTARPIFDSLINRERLGSTGLGHGVALPHGRFSQSQQAIGAFIKLRKGVDFDAIDRQPVDLVFGLLVPEQK